MLIFHAVVSRAHFRYSVLVVLLALLACPPRRMADAGELQAVPAALRLPPSCQTDFRGTLEAPAGKHGFLGAGGNGHFYFADGTRARFWGINVSSTRLDIPPEQIEQVVENFARAGLNMVRLEAIDNRNCLLGGMDAPDSQHFDPRYLDRLDYWMDALRRHGLYYYLDLLDFRTFKAGDDVLNADRLDRGARPYALFDPYLIQLQQEYATRLLTHRNPYSGLRPVDDSALALVEICNEHGFFLYPEKLETLVEPYRANLRALWNQWLLRRYGSRDALDRAWGTTRGIPNLRVEEDPTANTVDLPLLLRGTLAATVPNADLRRSPARMRDGVAFLTEMQRAYFRQMRDHLRSLGLRVPVTAVVSSDVIPDVASVAQECDFTSENWYGESINDDARTPGVTYYSNRNQLRDDSAGGFAPYTAGLRWNHKPVVIREWATTWPNRFRAASIPEALAYAALQDYDAILLFGYQTNRAPNGAEADALNDYAFQSDPSVWGLVALAGRAFLSGTIRPAPHTLTLNYSPDRLLEWPNGLTDLHRAAWCTRVESLTGEAGLTQRRRDAEDSRKGAKTQREGKREEENSFLISHSSAPSADQQTLRRFLDGLALRGAACAAKSVQGGVWRSDTGQIARFVREGRVEIVTPTLRMLAGEFLPDKTYALGNLRFTTPTRFGALIALALDGRPIEQSRHLVVKMVSRAENAQQTLIRLPGRPAAPWALTQRGHAPILTFGRYAAQPTRLWQVFPTGGKKTPAAIHSLLTLHLIDGTWEMESANGRTLLACDTPGIAGNALGRAFTTQTAPVLLTSR